MRMIATILGCPFRLSIFPEDAQEDAHMMQYANLVGGPKRSRKQKAENETEEMYQQTLVFDEKLEPVDRAGTDRDAAESGSVRQGSR